MIENANASGGSPVAAPDDGTPDSGVVQGMWVFQGRSSHKTWIFRIHIKSVGGVNALHPRSPTAFAPPPATLALRTLDSHQSRRHGPNDQSGAPAIPARAERDAMLARFGRQRKGQG